jgi:glucuronoarabinoxylan endo-1,4-beta-xylanase
VVPNAPTGLTATAGNALVSLTWSASSGATSYNVKRSTTSGGPYTTIGSPTTANYTDSSVTNGTTYYYVVSAVNSAGESGNSAEVKATPIAPPAAPTGLTATAGNAQVALSWNASAGATSYNVKRSTTSGSGYSTISSPATNSYTDTAVTNGTPYYYVVSAVNSGGESGNSAEVKATPNAQPVQGATATIDFSNLHQTIRGFGASDAWIGLDTTGEASALFGTNAGQIGLSILRSRIDPSSVTGGSNWDGEVAAAQAAIAAGSNVSIIATPWTPPTAWKINIPDPTNPLAEGSLDPNHYSDYANYLESFVNYMAKNGVSLYGISMQNEPDANVTYESCVWTPAQMDTWVANNASVLTTKLIMPESEGFNAAYSDPALNDPNAVGKIGIIAGHLYGVTPTYYANAVNAKKEVWMTEHYLNPAAAPPGLPNIGDALLAAKEIHDSMTVAYYNAYVWWWVKNWNSTTNIGLVDANDNPTYFGWAVAQFAQFIRPGYVRVDAAYSTPGVYVSAYEGGGHFVIVAINMSTSVVSQPFEIQNQSLSSLVPYQTTGSATMAQQGEVSVVDNQFTYDLPAESITTFVQ